MPASATIITDKTDITHHINTLYPKAHAVRHIEHGYENHIVIVDNHYVVRFPRSQAIWQRAKLEYFALSRLNSPLVPKIIRRSDSPAYLVQTFLPGEHLSEETFRQLPVATQQSIGRQVAEFAFTLHNTLTVADFKREYAQLTPKDDDGSYGDHLQAMLQDYTFPTEAQDKVAKQYFKAWVSIKPSKLVVVHDDLHIHNLLFRANLLSGVLDFGALCVGTAEQELRQVYRLSEEALQAAAETYDSLAHTKLDIEAARIWATTQELAMYAHELKANRLASPVFKRAHEHLALWLPAIF